MCCNNMDRRFDDIDVYGKNMYNYNNFSGDINIKCGGGCGRCGCMSRFGGCGRYGGMGQGCCRQCVKPVCYAVTRIYCHMPYYGDYGMRYSCTGNGYGSNARYCNAIEPED